MGHTTTVEPLVVSGAVELTRARAHLDELIVAARTLTAVSGHDPGVSSCEGAGCALVALPLGAPLCSLARRLGALDTARGDGAVIVPVPGASIDASTAAMTFSERITAALDAVRDCRRTAHPGGACWFTAAPDRDGCAEVLRLAHRLG